ALVATSALSTAAFAATSANHDVGHPSERTPQMAEQCSVLESQYSDAIATHQNAPKLDKAQGFYSMGVSQCNDNQGAIGVEHLSHALEDLGVRPAV
ncbi:MAG TPA: hypothetical protein VMT54_14875, partial [Candidatus Cybelea sp.]|nr:hypothetical protein [Candidatus Cybelea sp.]